MGIPLIGWSRTSFDEPPSSVKVHSIAVNPVDPLYVAHPTDAPGRIVGSDIAGVVDKIGETDDSLKEGRDWKVGDRVAGLLQGGTSQQHIVNESGQAAYYFV